LESKNLEKRHSLWDETVVVVLRVETVNGKTKYVSNREGHIHRKDKRDYNNQVKLAVGYRHPDSSRLSHHSSVFKLEITSGNGQKFLNQQPMYSNESVTADL
jgi:hypothetical protein